MTREEAIQIIKARFYPSHVGLITNQTRENAKALRMAVEALSALPSAEAVSMEEHIKELNDLAVAWKEKFAKAEKITDEIYDETMAKVAKECEECRERLRNIRPSAEAVQGEWIMHGEPPWYVRECSECGTKWHQWSGDANPNYCGHCGAKMKGGEDE